MQTKVLQLRDSIKSGNKWIATVRTEVVRTVANIIVKNSTSTIASVSIIMVLYTRGHGNVHSSISFSHLFNTAQAF